MKIIKTILAIAVIVPCAAILFVLSKMFKDSSLVNNADEVDTLTMEKVIAFFKNDEIVSILKEDANIKAVVTKKGSKEDKTHIICTLFDTKSEKIVYMDKYILNVLVKNIDDDLSQAFGDKDMIVLG